MARKLLSTLPHRSAESRSWAGPFSGEAAGDNALPSPSAEDRLQQARDVFTILAKAQKGLTCESQADSVTLNFLGAPGAEAAVLEAAERFAVGGKLVLQRGAMLVQLRLPQADDTSDVDPPFIAASLEAAAG